jgi:hypothetical protein
MQRNHDGLRQRFEFGTLRNSGGAITPPNSLMSAPAMKVRPAQISTTACADLSVARSRVIASSPRRMAAEIALTGGLSTVMTATPDSITTLTGFFTTQDSCKETGSRDEVSAREKSWRILVELPCDFVA